ncbi:MAG TPA: hypothetical protein VKR32_02960 [Puia sp.]|nr:hypothetical protein [Puia sp.]
MRKNLIHLSIIMVIAATFASQSCTKTTIRTVTVTDTIKVTVNDTILQNPPPTIVGFWVGSYKVPGYPDSAFLSFDLRPDSVLLVDGLGFDGVTYYSEGTYSLSGTSFSYIFTTLNGSNTGVMETGTGTYSAGAGTLIGALQISGTSVTGTFSLTKSP